MRLERSFEPHSPDTPSFSNRGLIRSAAELKTFDLSTEVILFSKIDEKKDTETPDQAPEINQTNDLSRAPVNGDWEPISQEPTENNRFLNFYHGNYAQDMEINRKRVEQAIKVAGLEGNVVLTSLSYSRTRSIEANPDGSVASKRGLLWGEKPEDVENPYHRITSIPEGWRVEICDQRIMDELSEKYSAEALKKKTVESINRYLRAGMREAVRREKFTTEKDSHLGVKVISSLAFPAFVVGLSASTGLELKLADLYGIGAVFLAYWLFNSSMHVSGDEIRSFQSVYEYFMPSVEVDRFLRGWAYLNLKGRNLVRLHKDE